MYTTAKSDRPAMPVAEAPSAALPATADAPVSADQGIEAVAWVVPEGWRRQAEERPMRVATFEAGEGENVLEIAVSQFPGDVGGLLANVNRWRSQIGLEPTSEAELAGLISHFDTPGFHGHGMRLEGPTQHMVVVSLDERQAGRTWFVRATGPAEVIDVHEAQVRAFARSFNVAAAEQAGDVEDSQ